MILKNVFLPKDFNNTNQNINLINYVKSHVRLYKINSGKS
ncbi:MAG: hypothetical protein ACI87N_001475 [Flavobacteriales bacterium]|jgi:hypothetical protein